MKVFTKDFQYLKSSKPITIQECETILKEAFESTMASCITHGMKKFDNLSEKLEEFTNQTFTFQNHILKIDLENLKKTDILEAYGLPE